MSIENIIFDLGGVLIDIDVDRSRNAFMELGLVPENSLYSREKIELLLDALEKGQISYASFRDEFRAMIGRDISDTALDEAWNAMLLDFPVHRIELLRNLSSKYKVFLLSNTNKKHISVINNRIEVQYSIKGLDPLFHDICYSFDCGKRKPDTLIYKTAIRKFGIDAGKTVFIDDTFDNIVAARKTGIKSFHLTDGIDVSNYFDEDLTFNGCCGAE